MLSEDVHVDVWSRVTLLQELGTSKRDNSLLVGTILPDWSTHVVAYASPKFERPCLQGMKIKYCVSPVSQPHIHSCLSKITLMDIQALVLQNSVITCPLLRDCTQLV